MKQLTLALSMFLIGLCQSTTAQDIRHILSNATDFREAVSQGEDYFATKHPGKTPKELCEGIFRDGDYVKFMRWQAFWKERLNPDGSLGDMTAFHRQSTSGRGGSGLYDDIEWSNISYENYIGVQIGLGRTTSLGFHPTDPDIFYVGAAIGGVWKTTDGGSTYTPIGDELPFLAVSSIVVNQDNPNEIYIALSDHVWYGPASIGVYKSTDAGATWNPTALSMNIADNKRIYWMIADPTDADRVFVATESGLYRTDDGFETVELITTINCTDVKFQPGNATIVYAGSSGGNFYRSTDSGVSFSLVQSLGSGSVMIAVTPLDPNKVYVRSGTALKKSTDGGLNFGAAFSMPDNNGMLVFSPTDDAVLIAGSFDVWKSTNNGSSFTQISHWLGDSGLPLIHVDQRNVFTNPLQDDRVYLCNDGGVYALIIDDGEFVNLSEGLLITQFYDIAVSQTDPNIVGGGSQDNGNVYRDSEGVWHDYASTGDGMNQDIDPTNANIRYWSYQLGGMRRFQSGNNTGIAPPGEDGNGAWETPYKIDYSFPNRLICAFGKVYESWNKGNTWEEISGNLAGGSDMEQLAIAPSNQNRIYVSRAGSIWTKDVFTNDWTQNSLPGGSISDLEVDPIDMNIVYVTVPGYSDGNKVFKSIDACETWINISGSLPNVSTAAVETYNLVAGALFVGTDAGVFYIDNTLSDWEPYGDLPNTRVEDIEIQYSNQWIRIGTHGRGVLEAPVTIGVCENGQGDSDGDGICDEFDACPNFDDNLLGTSCEDGDDDTYDDIYVDCDVCEGVFYLSVDDHTSGTFILYPNPAHDLLTIRRASSEKATFQLYTLEGRLALETPLTAARNVIELGSLAGGMYVANVISATGQVSRAQVVIR
jgi:photosystem II stability/assembly factor-like uncharacterized protein